MYRTTEVAIHDSSPPKRISNLVTQLQKCENKLKQDGNTLRCFTRDSSTRLSAHRRLPTSNPWLPKKPLPRRAVDVSLSKLSTYLSLQVRATQKSFKKLISKQFFAALTAQLTCRSCRRKPLLICFPPWLSAFCLKTYESDGQGGHHFQPSFWKKTHVFHCIIYASVPKRVYRSWKSISRRMFLFHIWKYRVR